MALKPYRRPYQDNQYFFGAVAERGGVACFTSANASGVPLEQAGHSAEYVATPSGEVPVGVLAWDVVNQNLAERERNYSKQEAQINEPVCVYEDAEVTTDMIMAGHTPTRGGTAYLAHSGLLATVDVIGGNITVGVWSTEIDQNGFASVRVKLPKV